MKNQYINKRTYIPKTETIIYNELTLNNDSKILNFVQLHFIYFNSNQLTILLNGDDCPVKISDRYNFVIQHKIQAKAWLG